MALAHTASKTVLPFAAALLLAGCGSEPADTTYEADVVDESGGEFIVTDPQAEGVEVQLPETPMTPVPPESQSLETPTPEPLPTPE